MRVSDDDLCDWCEQPVCNGRMHGEGHCFGGPDGLPLNPSDAYSMGKRHGAVLAEAMLAFERVTVAELRRENARLITRLMDMKERCCNALSAHDCARDCGIKSDE